MCQAGACGWSDKRPRPGFCRGKVEGERLLGSRVALDRGGRAGYRCIGRGSAMSILEGLRKENGMLSGSRRGPTIALTACLLLWAPSSFAQATPARAPDGVATPGAEAPHVARNLAFAYLDIWSAPNRVTLASVSSFYGSTVTFHGRTRPARLHARRETPVCGALAQSGLSPSAGDNSGVLRGGRGALHRLVDLRFFSGQFPPRPTLPWDRGTRARRKPVQRPARDRVRKQPRRAPRARQHDRFPQRGTLTRHFGPMGRPAGTATTVPFLGSPKIRRATG